jgi:hypothetical protein
MEVCCTDLRNTAASVRFCFQFEVRLLAGDCWDGEAPLVAVFSAKPAAPPVLPNIGFSPDAPSVAMLTLRSLMADTSPPASTVAVRQLAGRRAKVRDRNPPGRRR